VNMKHIGTFPALTLCILTGCAQMGTRQLDRNETTRYDIDKKGQTNAITTEVRTTSTRATGTAFGAGKTALRGFEASQDGGNQGLKIKETSQQTDGLTQAVQAFQTLGDIARMMKGFPPSESVQPAPQPIQPTRTVPAGMKWILAPKDDPSEPQPEE